MHIELATKEWIHPSLAFPKSAKYYIGLNEACLKYV